MAVFIGSSGWSYDHQAGVFHPKSVSSLERLDAYARLFRTVELNNTFYRWPKDEVFSTWRERLPGGFFVAAEASRGLTLFRKQDDPIPWLERMEAGLSRLGEKRGMTSSFPGTMVVRTNLNHVLQSGERPREGGEDASPVKAELIRGSLETRGRPGFPARRPAGRWRIHPAR
jgi:uncharacterized protein YecE (DUF72 family)